MGDYARRKQHGGDGEAAVGAPGMDAFWAGVAKGSAPSLVGSLVDPRVPGKAADPTAMLAYIDVDHDVDPVAMAAKVTAQLAQSAARAKAFTHAKAQPFVDALIEGMEHTDERDGRFRFINTLERLDDPALRDAVLARFQAQTGRSVPEVIASSEWYGSRDAAQATALISPERAKTEREIAALPPEQRARLKAEARKTATEIANVVGRGAATDKASAQKIQRALAGKTPAQIEALRAAVREQTRGNEGLYEQLDRSLAGSHEDEAIASLTGDPIHAASVALENARGDATRLAEILRGLHPAQLAALKRTYPAAAFVWMSVAPDQQAELGALVNGDLAAAMGAKVADLLRDPHHGARADGIQLDEQSKRNVEARSTENILRELGTMSPEKLARARAEWDAAAPARGEKTWDAMIEERFGDGDPLIYLRIRALAAGNKVEATALALAQGTRDHDQALIEDSLVNPDLSSKDPAKRAAAREHQRAVAARFQELGIGTARAMAAMQGGDVASARGDSLDTALANHTKHQAATNHQFDSASDAHDAFLAPEKLAARARKRARVAEIGTDELREHGAFSTATEIHRARAAGNEGRVAQILEGQADRTAVNNLDSEYFIKYGEELFQQPAPEKIDAYRQFHAMRGVHLSREEAAYELRDTHENRTHAVKESGPRAVRTNEQQHELDRREHEHQRSEAVAVNDLTRKLAFGHAAGTTERVQWSLANQADAIDGPREEFDQHAAHTRSMADAHREEKIAMGERAAQWLAIAGKLAALATLNPAAMAAIDALVGVATVLVREDIEGESYKTAGQDLVDTAVTVATDLAMLPVAKIQSAVLRAAYSLGISSTSIMVHNTVAGRDEATAIDLLRNLLLSLVVNPAGDKAEKLLGNGRAGKIANTAINATGSSVVHGANGVMDLATNAIDAGGGHLAKGKPRGGPPDRPSPIRTPHGDVWPGDVPVGADHPHHAIYVEANAKFAALHGDALQESTVARVAWAQHLAGHGIPLEGRLDPSRTEVDEHRPAPHMIADSDLAVPRERPVGERSKNTQHVDMATSRAALDDLFARGTILAGARRAGDRIEVPRHDGSIWVITLAEPRGTRPDQMAALIRGEDGDTVWVSNMLTNEEVPAALGAIIGESLARSRGERGGSQIGELDAMLARRDTVASTSDTTLPGDAPAAAVKEHALQMSKKESAARIDAEIDLVLVRMGMHDASMRDQHLASMPPELASRVRERLARHPTLTTNSAAIRAADQVARPTGTPPSHIGVSDVLPEAPSAVRPYGEADRVTVAELRVELEIIREIDARTAQRDRPGTNGGVDIARGETRRREQHVKRARALMEQLQLGGDSAYIRQRLAELSEVFPGVANDVVPAIEHRVARRDSAALSHAEAEAFRAVLAQRQAELIAYVTSTPVLTTKRLVVGDGFSAMADVATLGAAKDGAWIDPKDLLVIGMPALLDLLAAYDPAFRWGQRAATYDRPTDAHPAFSDSEGHGTGALDRHVEDAGDFMRVGELRDAMDLARKRLGMAAVPGEVQHVETAAERHADSPPWEVDEAKYPVRTKVVVAGVERYVYAESTDLATGPGKPRMPNEAILAAGARAKLMGDTNGTGALFSGEKLLQGRDVSGQRVLVLAFGPTGAWVAKVAANQGAARVDFASASGNRDGTGASPEKAYSKMAAIDRVQDAIDGSSNIHVTLDRVVSIEPQGEGAIVTYAKTPGEDAEVYQVHYDVIVTAMGYSTAYDSKSHSAPVPGEPTVKDIIGDTRMQPQRGSRAPVLEDKATGRVRVIGYAAGDNINIDDDEINENGVTDANEIEVRRATLRAGVSADSPDGRVVEGVGMGTRRANMDRRP